MEYFVFIHSHHLVFFKDKMMGMVQLTACTSRLERAGRPLFGRLGGRHLARCYPSVQSIHFSMAGDADCGNSSDCWVVVGIFTALFASRRASR